MPADLVRAALGVVVQRAEAAAECLRRPHEVEVAVGVVGDVHAVVHLVVDLNYFVFVR